MTKLLRSLAQDASGATAVEYGLMIGLIALGIIVAVTLLGESLKGLFEKPELNQTLG